MLFSAGASIFIAEKKQRLFGTKNRTGDNITSGLMQGLKYRSGDTITYGVM